MNTIVAAVVGALVAVAVTVGGVNMAQGGDQKRVAETTLFQYSDE